MPIADPRSFNQMGSATRLRTALMALGYFDDGDVSSISEREKDLLTGARDRVRDLPEVELTYGSLVVDIGPCEETVSVSPK